MIINSRGLGRRLQIALLCFLCVAGLSQHVTAAPYGRGGYSHCGYQACTQPASTRLATPAGLDVAVNLTNGQTVPRSGYTITVTPLNGQGSSFAKVAFYLNGTLAYAATPDTTGTVRWAWKPGPENSVKLKIVVTDAQGGAITKEFSLNVQATVTSNAAPAAGVNPEKNSGISGAIQHVYNGAKQAVNALPSPVVYSFPYFLFGLLGTNVLLLLLQAKRELREYHTLRALLTRIQAVNDGKQTLTQLMSHYLRTPLTIMMGGIELFQKEPAGQATAGSLQATARRIQTKIDALIAQTQRILPVVETSAAPGLRTAQLWRRPGLFLPLLLIAAIVLPFNYVAAHADSVSINQGNILVQISIFGILALASYQVFRRLQLRKQDARHLQHLADMVHADSQARDSLITATVDTLNEELQALDALSSPLPATRSTTFIHDGVRRLHTVMGKFAVAKRLQGGHNDQPTSTTTLQALVDKATAPLAAIANERSILVQAEHDIILRVPNPELLTTVLTSLLDNAIAYSPDHSSITITAQLQTGQTTITIHDHGTGIPASKLPLLLQPFSKAEGALTFTHEGMGFSLYLDKIIMTYLGGSIALDSTPAQGTTVTLQLP